MEMKLRDIVLCKGLIMTPYMNVGYENDKFGDLTHEETNMERLMIYQSFIDKKINYEIHNEKTAIYKCEDKNHLKIWLDLNGFKIYRAYIYTDELINHEYMSRYYGDSYSGQLLCQCLLKKC